MGQAGGDRKWLLLTWGCAAVARVCGCTPKLLAPLGTRPRLAPMLGCNRLQFNPSGPAAATPLSPSLGRARAHFGYFGQGREQGRELLQLGVLGQPESPSVEPSRGGLPHPVGCPAPRRQVPHALWPPAVPPWWPGVGGGGCSFRAPGGAVGSAGAAPWLGEPRGAQWPFVRALPGNTPPSQLPSNMKPPPGCLLSTKPSAGLRGGCPGPFPARPALWLRVPSVLGLRCACGHRPSRGPASPRSCPKGLG